MPKHVFTDEERRRGGKTRAAQLSFQAHNRRIAPLGGQALFEQRGVDYMRKIGQRGLQALADKRFEGDVEVALVWLVQQGLKALDPAPENGAWVDFQF